MSWVVDSCVLLDVALRDPEYGVPSALFLEEKRADGLVACPITLVEVAPVFGGNLADVRTFLKVMGAEAAAPWMEADTEAAAAAWTRHVERKRAGKVARRPVADILIGAFACRHGGLITRNPDPFRASFPHLVLAQPPRTAR